MSLSHTAKQLFRHFGIELKHAQFGLDLELDLLALFREQPARTIIDIGANVGQTTRKYSQLFPEASIWSIEPNPEIFPTLCESAAGNSRITPVNIGMGAAKSELKLKIMGASVNSSFLHYVLADGTDRQQREIAVPVERLDDFAEARGIERVDLVKSDTQGYDAEVLRGASRLLSERRIRALIVEVNFATRYQDQGSFSTLHQILFDSGMRLCGFYGVNRESDFHVHWADALFVNPPLCSPAQ